MNDEILLRLTGLMEKLGFNCDDGSFTKAEMRAYAAGISLVKDMLDEGFNQIFTDTMGDKGLLMYCEMLGIDTTGENEELKQQIISRLSENYRTLTRSQVREAKKNTSGYSERYVGFDGPYFYIDPVNKENLTAFANFRKSYYTVCNQLTGGGSGIKFDKLDGLDLRWLEFEEFDFPFYVWDTFTIYNYS